MGKRLVPVPISAASAQMAARHLLNRKTGLLANFRCGYSCRFGRTTATFAVGTRVTSRPPHRSVRAQFGHTAPTLGV